MTATPPTTEPHMERPGPAEFRDPLVRREMAKAAVWFGIGLAILGVIVLGQPLLLIVGGAIFAVFLDGGARLLARYLPIPRAWRLLLVCGDPADPSTYFAGFDKSQVSPISCPDNLAFDKRGQIVTVTISDYSLLFGGATRSGKGMGVANVLAGALLDPRVNVRLFDGKGTGEYVPYAPVLATFVRRNPARLRDFLRVMVGEMNRRTEILVELGLSKLSEALIDRVGGIELVVVDELATYTAPEGPSKEYAEEIVEYLAQLAAVGAAVGIVLVLATQYPEVAIVPSRLRGNCSGRMAMRTENADASNTILGKGMAGNGYDSSKIANSKGTRGRGWLTTPDTGMIAARSLFIDESTGENRTIIAIGTELRRTAGTLPGHCTDPVEDALLRMTGASSVAGGRNGNGGIVRGTILDHLVTAAAARGALTSAEAFAVLARVAPEQYAPRDGETDAALSSRAGKALKAQLAALGVELEASKVTGADGGRANGYTLAALQTAADTARNARN